MEVIYKKIPIPELMPISSERDHAALRDIWNLVRDDELKKGFMAEIYDIEIVLYGDDFIKNLYMVVIKYTKVPLYN